MQILIVEDSAEIAQALASLLQNHGQVCEIAPTVAAALDASNRNHFDIAVIDLRLPDGSGSVLAPMLRAQGTRCVALTADRAAVARLPRNSGFSNKLLKPFKPAELEALLL